MDFDLELDLEDVCRRGVAQYVKEIKERAKDLRPAWDAVLTALHMAEVALFMNQGKSTGNPAGWDPLSDRPIRFHKINGEMVGYATWKHLTYPGKKIGELTGKLRRQLTGEDNTAYVQRGVRKLTFGTNYEDYSGVSGRPRSGRDRLTGDLGGIASEGRSNYFPMPARLPIDLSTGDEYFVADRLLDYILDAPEF